MSQIYKLFIYGTIIVEKKSFLVASLECEVVSFAVDTDQDNVEVEPGLESGVGFVLWVV